MSGLVHVAIRCFTISSERHGHYEKPCTQSQMGRCIMRLSTGLSACMLPLLTLTKAKASANLQKAVDAIP